MALAVCFLFAGCNKYGVIKKAYEDAGWTVSTEIEQYQDQINTAIAEENREDIADVHVFVKNIVSVAIIVEFKSTESLVEAVENSATLQGFIEDAQNSDYVSGNCVLITLSPAALEVFKTTK